MMMNPIHSSSPNQSQSDQYQQYLHLMQIYQPHNIIDLPKIGMLLGYVGFDRFLNLYQAYRDKKFGEVCAMCEEIKVEGLLLGFNQCENMIKQIGMTRLPYLHTLDLTSNNIASIEALPQLYMPNIATITLSGNKISNLRPLRRMVFPNLITIDLSLNLYLELPQSVPIGCQFSGKVIDKAVVFKVAVTQNGAKKRLSDYFR